MENLRYDNRADYEEYLKSADISDVEEYDSVLTEYLTTYCMDGIDDDFFVSNVIHRFYELSEPGSVYNTEFYKEILCSSKEGFLKNNENQLFEIFSGSYNNIVKDVLSRFHESGIDEGLSDFEMNILRAYFIDSAYVPEGFVVGSGLSVSDVRGGYQNNLDDNGNVVLAGRFKTGLANLVHDPDAVVDHEKGIGQYLIRLKKDFSGMKRPDGDIGEIYDAISNLDIGEYLKCNWRDRDLYGETQKNVEQIKAGKNSYINGVLVAYELLAEYDINEAIKEFDELKDILEDGLVNIYDTGAMDLFVEQYLDDQLRGDVTFDGKTLKIIEEYVKFRASKGDFNLFKEQGVSDLLQYQLFCQNKGVDVPDFFGFVRDCVGKVGVENYQEVIDKFISDHKNRRVSLEEKADFEEFLRALTFKKLDSLNVMSQDEIDFIIEQASRRDSIVYMNNKEYQCVVERALEDLGKRDFMNESDNDRTNHVYFIRDYIRKATEAGIHSESTIALKRDFVDKFCSSGDLEIFDIVFHENQHEFQKFIYKKSIADNIKEYNMIKESYIMSFLHNHYYNINYKYMYNEVDAREAGATKCAEYFSKIVDGLEQDKSISPELISDYRKKINKKRQVSLEERENYDKAHYCKKNFLSADFEDYSVEDVFESVRAFFDKDKDKDGSRITKFPSLVLEYDLSGRRKSIKEVMETVEELGVNRDFALEVIKDSKTMSRTDDLAEIAKYISESVGRPNEQERFEFVEEVLGVGLKGCFEKCLKELEDYAEGGMSFSFNGACEEFDSGIEKLAQILEEAGIDVDKRNNEGLSLREIVDGSYEKFMAIHDSYEEGLSNSVSFGFDDDPWNDNGGVISYGEVKALSESVDIEDVFSSEKYETYLQGRDGKNTDSIDKDI